MGRAEGSVRVARKKAGRQILWVELCVRVSVRARVREMGPISGTVVMFWLVGVVMGMVWGW